MPLEAHTTHSSKELRFEPETVWPQNSGSLCASYKLRSSGWGGRGWSPMAEVGAPGSWAGQSSNCLTFLAWRCDEG